MTVTLAHILLELGNFFWHSPLDYHFLYSKKKDSYKYKFIVKSSTINIFDHIKFQSVSFRFLNSGTLDI